MQSQSFKDNVYTIIAAIPKGKVTTYGEIARLAGAPSYVRQVCLVLRQVPKGSSLPCYRIINGQGRISVKSPHYERHKAQLQKEGIVFSDNDKIDLTVFGWKV